MLASIRKRIEREDEGFTLIELMVVVLIIAILLAIAIPTFLGARERAQNRAAQSDIRNALAAEKVFYTDDEIYTGDDAAGLVFIKSIEPSLTYTNATADADDAVYVDVRSASATATTSAVCLGRTSKSGKSFSLLDVAVGTNAGTYYYENVNCASGGGAAEDGTAVPTGEKTGW